MFVRRDPNLRIEAAGYFYGDDLRSATESGRWVDYVLINPESGEDRQKPHLGRSPRRPALRLRLVRVTRVLS